MSNFKFKDNAIRWVAMKVRQFHNVYFDIVPLQRNKHFLLLPPVTRVDVPKFYVLFKRDFFMSFNLVFKDFVKSYPDYNTVGESINEDVFKAVKARGVDYLIFAYDNSRRVYKLSVGLLDRFYKTYNLVRVQDKLNKTSVGKKEKTICFPVNIMERMGDF